MQCFNLLSWYSSTHEGNFTINFLCTKHKEKDEVIEKNFQYSSLTSSAIQVDQVKCYIFFRKKRKKKNVIHCTHVVCVVAI